ncbi:Dihydropteroate synthase [Pseudovirgaria hyperparasitica]|uniref:Dihydropteroate synthase n=1 Tax=Pseudovirgaria hyperparasitica TaxID=470096 RepID=A0A6A6WLL2_9PEZI|nr:Dihydropteroate synthase [Pseudovirgaria hyperparasitica]KAF2763095.1 Dihydropteroate synthase [Pseudovirgaria hyperparasitica]
MGLETSIRPISTAGAAATSMARSSAHRPHRAFIALGSNMGDRISWIEKACNAMESTPDIKIRRTSSLWETTAMYVLDQENFVNGACEIETSLGPIHLLDRLQSIENDLGRVKVIDKGPRNIDLDILLYDDRTISHPRLQVPHALMLEREFVLRPLCELIPASTLPGSPSGTTLSNHLAALPASPTPLSTITSLAPGIPPIASLHTHRNTLLMSILNLTPDSFSNGPSPPALTNPLALANAELARLSPFLDSLSALPPNIALSIDTFHASVAAAALDAGIHIINDVSAASLDPAMLPLAASRHCTLILMHMRGSPATMSKLTSYPHGVVHGVATELAARVAAAEAAGVRRWRIVLDPGLGFAKTPAQSIELLRRLPELRRWPGLEGLPWLVGPSRKGFVGVVTGERDAARREFGTAAAVSACVAGGADVVRVHDTGEMARVVRMADAVWRF